MTVFTLKGEQVGTLRETVINCRSSSHRRTSEISFIQEYSFCVKFLPLPKDTVFRTDKQDDYMIEITSQNLIVQESKNQKRVF